MRESTAADNRYFAGSTIASVVATLVCCSMLWWQKLSVVFLFFAMPLIAANGFIASLRRARAAPRSILAIAFTGLHAIGTVLAITIVVILLRQSSFHAFD